ncbi:phage major capsid protein [Promicromonospora sp. NPDC050880]|uniref:phage major capsid protein n=1 Tax=Promicromonospora sp. NPDC050880 TaxID=3364406 RepID=UPI00379BDF85
MSAAYIKQLEELRDGLAEATVAVINGATKEGRSLLTADERQNLDNLEEARLDAEKRLAKAKEAEQRAADIEASFRNSPEGREAEGRGSASDSAFATWIRESRAGEKYDVPMNSRALLAAAEKRAMSMGGTAPAGVHNQLWEYAVESSELLTYVQLMTTTDGNTIPMPRATVHADVDDADIAPNGAIPDSDSTINTVDLSVAKRGFKTAVPNELIADAAFDVEGYVARNAGRALGNEVARAGAVAAEAGFTVTGVTTPAGVLTGLGNQSTVGQGSDLLVDLLHSVIAPYRASSGVAFGMSDSAAAIVRKLKTSTGEPVWQDALVAGNPDLILGKPVAIVPQFDPFAASSKPIWFGDWKALVVRIAGGLRFERSAEAGFGNDQTVFRALVRRGAVALDPNAVKALATPAA